MKKKKKKTGWCLRKLRVIGKLIKAEASGESPRDSSAGHMTAKTAGASAEARCAAFIALATGIKR